MYEAILLIVAVLIVFLLYKRSHLNGLMSSSNPIGSAAAIGERAIQADFLGSALGDYGAVLVIADGKGRGNDSKIAAKLAVETFLDLYADYQFFDKPQYYFQRAFRLANQKILNVLQECAGASAGAVLIHRNTMYYALVGSIQISVYRSGNLVPVSEGQTVDMLARRAFKAGRIQRETAISLLKEERAFNTLGQDGFHDIEFFSKPLTLEKGDIAVLMTDGVFHALKWREIEEAVKKGGSPTDIAERITVAVEKSDATDKDNASVILYMN
ncbi:MAG: SpoIIE family protein phosphatase [Selenomonadaceae bacterium]|nr:SpoIIE family protein phosphatase [Selenomonadaceae bacterium]